MENDGFWQLSEEDEARLEALEAAALDIAAH
jgi:hypothetical protein